MTIKKKPYSFTIGFNEKKADHVRAVRILNQLGKGEITEINTGHAGQLLRLLSVDALMRKLRFDFRDTFGETFRRAENVYGCSGRVCE